MAAQQTASNHPLEHQLPQGPIFHEDPAEQDEADMSSQPAKFTTTRVSGVRTESHGSDRTTAGANGTFVPIPGGPTMPSNIYFPPFAQPGVYSPQVSQEPPAGSGTHSPSAQAPAPPQPQSGQFINMSAPPGPSSSAGVAAPSLSVIFTHNSGVVTSPDSATPSTATSLATSLPSAAPPMTPEEAGESPVGGIGGNLYGTSASVPRLPPILQVEKVQVTTTATQAASASRRRNEAHFVCPVPGCGSTFTRRFNLRGHLRSHTEERPYVCEWPGCGKGFARQHDCKRHQALHSQRTQANVCHGCKKTFSRLDALNRHLRSDGGADCRTQHAIVSAAANAAAEGGAPDVPGPSSLDPSLSGPLASMLPPDLPAPERVTSPADQVDQLTAIKRSDSPGPGSTA